MTDPQQPPVNPGYSPASFSQPHQQQVYAGPGQQLSYGQPNSAPPAPQPRKPLKATTKILITWSLIGVLLLVSALAAIGALNRDVYGAGGFVDRYLSALAAKDSATALAMPGVSLDADGLAEEELPDGSSELLLRDEALADLSDVQLETDTDQGNGVHEVTFSYLSNGAYGESTFQVKSDGIRFPLLPEWSFETSPLAVVNLTVDHTTTFSANGASFDTRQATGDDTAAFSNIVNLLVFSPGQYSFAVDTEQFTSKPERVLVDEPAQVHEGELAAMPTSALLDTVQTAVDEALDACTTQTVLQPTGCPFGVVIDDRVASEPAWSLSDYPAVELAAGDESWEIVPVEGRAKVAVDVQSLFDGTVKNTNESVPFEMTGDVYVQADGAIDVRLRPVEQP